MGVHPGTLLEDPEYEKDDSDRRRRSNHKAGLEEQGQCEFSRRMPPVAADTDGRGVELQNGSNWEHFSGKGDKVSMFARRFASPTRPLAEDSSTQIRWRVHQGAETDTSNSSSRR